MKIQSLPLDQVKVKESKYRFCQVTVWDPQDIKLNLLGNSIKKLGILEPLLIHPVREGFHLVDGFKRAVTAPTLGIEDLPCCFLPERTSLQEMLELLLIEHRHKICSTLASKVRFISFALRLGVEKEPLVQHFVAGLDLKGHEAVLKQVEAIARLPEKVLDFCDEKNFSMRQCAQLTRYPGALLLNVFSWKDELSLTASIVEEILGNLNDYLRGTGRNLSEFLDDRDVKSLLSSSLSPHEKTEQLRTLIKERRYPILTNMNHKLRRLREEMF